MAEEVLKKEVLKNVIKNYLPYDQCVDITNIIIDKVSKGEPIDHIDMSYLFSVRDYLEGLNVTLSQIEGFDEYDLMIKAPGKWIDTSSDGVVSYKCDKCHYEVSGYGSRTPFCPSCSNLKTNADPLKINVKREKYHE